MVVRKLKEESAMKENNNWGLEQEGVVGGELGLVVQSVCSGAELI